MGEVWFYHLTGLAPEAALPPLLQRSLAQGWRVELRGRDRTRMAALDRALWIDPADGFLPHGLAGGVHDALQPVLLTTGGAGAGRFDCVMTLDGAGLDPAEVAGLARACILFDGRDDAALEVARGQWRELTAAGIGAQYWAEEGGRWSLRQTRPAGTPVNG